MPVYLARFGLAGPVKIGMSLNVGRRLDHIGSRLWDDIRLLRLLDGTAEDERRLHRRLIAQRMRKDCFNFNPYLLGDLGLTDLTQQPERHLPSWSSRRESSAHKARATELRAWMIDHGLSDIDLARAVGCQPSAVTGWLRFGTLPRISIRESLIELSEGLLAQVMEFA